MAGGIQFPDQGLNLGLLPWELSPSHWTTREVPHGILFYLVFLLTPDPAQILLVSLLCFTLGSVSRPSFLLHHFLCCQSFRAVSWAQPWMASTSSVLAPFYIWVMLCVSLCISVIKSSSWPFGSFPKWSIDSFYSERLVFQQSINNLTYSSKEFHNTQGT